MNPFSGPSPSRQLDRQPVEKLGVSRRLPLGTEFLAGHHQARAKNLLPAAIGNHPGRQRILLGHQPASQGQAVDLAPRRERRERGRNPSTTSCP